MAHAAGVILTLEDMDQISRATPLLARVYPNGSADVNHFQAAGGMAFVIRELLKAGLVHEDVQTIAGHARRHKGDGGIDRTMRRAAGAASSGVRSGGPGPRAGCPAAAIGSTKQASQQKCARERR